jgi:hypothetical protein
MKSYASGTYFIRKGASNIVYKKDIQLFIFLEV